MRRYAHRATTRDGSNVGIPVKLLDGNAMANPYGGATCMQPARRDAAREIPVLRRTPRGCAWRRHRIKVRARTILRSADVVPQALVPFRGAGFLTRALRLSKRDVGS